jgi:4-alpha-glucanotransferase
VTDAIQQLALHRGVGHSYHDYRGDLRQIPRASQMAIFAAMGLDIPDTEAADAELRKLATTRWTRLVPPVVVLTQQGEATVPVAVLTELGARTVRWSVKLESGEERHGSASLTALSSVEKAEIDGRDYKRVSLPLPRDLPTGYHHLEVSFDTGACGQLRLIVTPEHCFQPTAIVAGNRVWGLSVQLYAVRSEQNWGMGDFGDLLEVIDLAAPLGCGIIGLNPLHALMPANPGHISPYSPSNRQFLNVLYIAVPDVPEFAECAPARELVASASFQTLLRALRAAVNVDYERVATAKLDILKLLYEHFRTSHLALDTPRAAAFRQFCDTFGEPLRLHAIFDALDADFRLQGPQYWGWPSWPEEYRDASSSAVNRFARDRATEVEYFLYLQWLAEEQLCAAQTAAREHGMSIGLYGDVAVGANPGGSETWANRRLYLRSASVGAPPDALALKGQDWGIPPQDPAELQVQQYEPFVVLIRNNMRPVAALRLDHVMTLYRLWWVPSGSASTDGGYVHYPLEDLFAILALESQRNHCAVIGEDLGTVPEAVTRAMERYLAYHYKVLLFEQELDGSFKSPEAYVSNAVATVTTHDLPTLRGWWEEHDLTLRDRLNLYPTQQMREQAHAQRAAERLQLLYALTKEKLWHWRQGEPLPPYSSALARAIHVFLGLSRAGIALIQLEDLIGMTDPVNVPGTDREHANWQRKILMNTVDIFARPEVRDMIDAMNRARRGENPNA